MTHTDRVYSRAQILDHVWGDHVFIEDRTVDVHIRRLRDALEPAATTAWSRRCGARATASVPIDLPQYPSRHRGACRAGKR